MGDKSKYAAEYERWINSLPPHERALAESLGVDKPMFDDHSTMRPDDSAKFQKIPVSSETESQDSANSKAQADLISSLAFIFGRLFACKTPRDMQIDLDALCFAAGLGFTMSFTGSQLAAKHGITRAAFSARVKRWQRIIGLKPSIQMRSERSCKKYRNERNNYIRRHGSRD